MSQGVNAAASRDPRRLGKGQRGVEQGDARGGFRVAAGHLLMGLLVGDEGKGLAFAARAAGGGDGEQGQHGARGPADAPVILHLAAVGENEVAALGGVHAAAAAQADDGVDGGAASDLDAALHAPGRGVLLDLLKARHLHAGGFQQGLHPAGMTGGHDPAVGDEQHLPGGETLGQFAHALDAVDAEDDPGPRLIIKRSRAVASGESGGIRAVRRVRARGGDRGTRKGCLRAAGPRRPASWRWGRGSGGRSAAIRAGRRGTPRPE